MAENVSSGLVMQWIEEEKRAITNDVAVPTSINYVLLCTYNFINFINLKLLIMLLLMLK